MDSYLKIAYDFSIISQSVLKDWGSRAVAWATLQSSYGLPDDFIVSIGLGLVLATTVFVFGNKPLSPEERKMRLQAIEEQDKPTSVKRESNESLMKKKENAETNSAAINESKRLNAAIDQVISPEMDVEEMVKKTERLAKKFGATEKDVRDAIEKVRDQQRRGLSAAEIEMEEPFMRNFVRWLEWVMYVLCAFGFFFCVNLYSGGDAGRVLCGMFPREMDLLGVTDYLNRFGAHGPMPAASAVIPSVPS